MALPLPKDFPTGFDRVFGLEVLEVSDTLARGQVRVRDELKQAYGIVHGGVYAALAESLSSIATALAVAEEGKLAVGDDRGVL